MLYPFVLPIINLGTLLCNNMIWEEKFCLRMKWMQRRECGEERGAGCGPLLFPLVFLIHISHRFSDTGKKSALFLTSFEVDYTFPSFRMLGGQNSSFFLIKPLLFATSWHKNVTMCCIWVSSFFVTVWHSSPSLSGPHYFCWFVAIQKNRMSIGSLILKKHIEWELTNGKEKKGDHLFCIDFSTWKKSIEKLSTNIPIILLQLLLTWSSWLEVNL